MRGRTLLGTLLVTAACAAPLTEGPADMPAPVGDPVAGASLYAANCAQCHGPALEGTDQGPSFLSDIYVQSHHADGAFQLAVTRGVQPHHWDFGPMPPIEGLSDQDVLSIVAFVRQQQAEAGIGP